MFKKTFLILCFIATLVGLALGYGKTCDLKIQRGRPCYGQGSPGTYYGFVKRYGRGKCRRFRYTGCGGNKNRFESNEKCEAACGEKSPPYASATPTPPPYEPAPSAGYPPEPGPYEPAPTPPSYGPTCPDDDPKIKDLQNQLKKKTDELKIYDGKYKSMKDMLKKCKESSYKPAYKPKYQKKFGFIKRDYGGICKPFNYAGCGGNQNKFNSKRECKKVCRPRGYTRKYPKQCKLRISKGRPCKPYEAPRPY